MKKSNFSGSGINYYRIGMPVLKIKRIRGSGQFVKPFRSNTQKITAGKKEAGKYEAGFMVEWNTSVLYDLNGTMVED